MKKYRLNLAKFIFLRQLGNRVLDNYRPFKVILPINIDDHRFYFDQL